MECDIYEKDDKYYVEVDVPGFKKEEIKIHARNGYLTISAEKSNEEVDNNKNYLKKIKKDAFICTLFFLAQYPIYFFIFCDRLRYL